MEGQIWALIGVVVQVVLTGIYALIGWTLKTVFNDVKDEVKILSANLKELADNFNDERLKANRTEANLTNLQNNFEKCQQRHNIN